VVVLLVPVVDDVPIVSVLVPDVPIVSVDVPLVPIESVAIVSVAIVSVMIVELVSDEVEVLIDVSVAAVSVLMVVSSFLQPTKRTSATTLRRTRIFFIRCFLTLKVCLVNGFHDPG
jgi:hypothetical protein